MKRAAKNARSEKPCAVYTHPHAGKNCRCIKLCANCGRSEEAHLEEAMEMAVESLTETIDQIQAANTYGRHAISGGEYTTIEGITYSIAPQGPNCLKYRDKIHPDSPYPDWYRHYPMRTVENYGL